MTPSRLRRDEMTTTGFDTSPVWRGHTGHIAGSGCWCIDDGEHSSPSTELSNNLLSPLSSSTIHNTASQHAFPHSCRSFSLGVSALLGAIVDAANLLDIGIVRPRENETYEPADYFPIIFGLQNADKAAKLNLDIDYFIRNGTENREAFGHSKHDLTDADFATEPYIVYDWRKVDTEGHFQVFGSVSWRVCDESGAEVAMTRNSSNLSVHFDIKRGAQKIDIPTVTAAKDNCSEWSGVVLDVTGQTSRIPDSDEVCPVIVTPSSTATANPCRVEIGTAAAASMSDALHASRCKGINPPSDCPKDEDDSSKKLVVAGIATFAAAIGVVGFLFA